MLRKNINEKHYSKMQIAVIIYWQTASTFSVFPGLGTPLNFWLLSNGAELNKTTIQFSLFCGFFISTLFAS